MVLADYENPESTVTRQVNSKPTWTKIFMQRRSIASSVWLQTFLSPGGLNFLIDRINYCSLCLLRIRHLHALSSAVPPVSVASCHSGLSRHSAPVAAWALDRRQSPGSLNSSNCPFQKVSPWKTEDKSISSLEREWDGGNTEITKLNVLMFYRVFPSGILNSE